MEFSTDIFSLFDKKWALLSAGTKDDHNTMTISWGGMGTLWNKPVVTVYVKPIRFTHKFMNENEYFTVSFLPEDKREALNVMGTMTGRHHTDKDAAAGLTVRDLGEAVTYEEAELVFLCRKVFYEDMITTHMPEEIVKQHYTPDEPHTLYIGEVVDIIRK
ncbi:MAG: flavin reductase [Mogibacterium sp.]|nr:flavin reductase [Mogibacterium sp.]